MLDDQSPTPDTLREQGVLRAGLPAGRLFGVPLRVSVLWVVVLVLVTLLYPSVAGQLVPGIDRFGSYLLAMAFAELLLVSVLVHELGHLLTCRRARVPVRAVVLGVPGGSVRHDPPRTPRQAALIALGGPLASIVLAGFCSMLAGLGLLTSGSSTRTAMVDAAAAINLVIGVFTLLPGLPMDGGGLVRAAVWAITKSPTTGHRVAGWLGRVLAIVLALCPLLFVRTGDLPGSAVVLVAGLLVAGYVWSGAEVPASRPLPATKPRTPAQATRAAAARKTRTWALVGGIAIAVILVVRAFVVQSLVVASGSMDDTLRVGDHIVVNKLSYLFSTPSYGDVVVLDRPAEVHVPEDVLVKRVIGLPGDHLQERDGHVYRNGAPITEPYIRPGCPAEAAGLNDVVVPDGKVYLLGDNRCNSQDSRSFGAIDIDLVEGRAVAVIWPKDRIGSVPGQGS